MKMSKIKTIAAFAAAAIFLGGCGDAPYTLTEGEEDFIIGYAAHMVTKFNSMQGEGLTYVNMDEMEEEPVTETQEETAEEDNAGGLQSPASDGSMPGDDGEAGAQEQAFQTVSLEDAFGTGDISIAYRGASLAPDYVENSYYALDPDAGKVFLILTFDITNSGAEEVSFDNLARSLSFEVTTADGTKAATELSVLMKDFATYQAAIPAGETQEAVLLFQIPDTFTEVPAFTLCMQADGVSYQIAL